MILFRITPVRFENSSNGDRLKEKGNPAWVWADTARDATCAYRDKTGVKAKVEITAIQEGTDEACQ